MWLGVGGFSWGVGVVVFLRNTDTSQVEYSR